MIEIKNLNKDVQDRGWYCRGIKNINFTVEDGEFTIFGMSGAWKSTLVRCINRLKTNVRSVRIDDVDLTKLL